MQISREENYPELDVVVDREKAGVLGLSEQQVAQTVLASLVGNTQFAPIPYTDPKTGNEYFINVRLDDGDRTHVADLADVFVRTADGGDGRRSTPWPRSKRGSGPVHDRPQVPAAHRRRHRQHRARQGPGHGQRGGRRRSLDELPPPEGFSAQLGGQTAAQQKAFAGLVFAALMALALVYMVLASQFKSLIDPLVIMFSVPLGVSRRLHHALAHRHHAQREQLHGHHHDGGHRGVERRAAGGLRQRAARARARRSSRPPSRPGAPACAPSS